MVEPPRTDEGWFALHDFRSVDWGAWRDATERERERAIEEGEQFLRDCEQLADSDAGDSAAFAVLGEGADLLLLQFRPALDDLSALERRLEHTALGGFLDRAESYVSVTEVSGYASDAWFEDDPDALDEGLRRYMEGKLYPEIPDDEYVSFYPMSKRRGETHNWYDLPFGERADLMAGHGEVGKRYAGRISQVISSSVGFDDHEWGVTLFGADPTDIKEVVYEMRFDEASSKYAEFGDFFVGRRLPPADLGAYLAGERVPTDGGTAHASGDGTDDGRGGSEDGDIRGELRDLDIYAGQPHGEDVYATVLYSEADTDDLFGEVEGLRSNFEHYDTHVRTAVYAARERDRAAVVSVWDTASAADTAAGFLADLPGVVARADADSGFGTMGMFYTVKPDYREQFHEKFDEVAELLGGIDGHRDTDLMVNVEDENDMFIASQWRSKDDAMAFFRGDAFAETVSWGRDALADRPRHVFLA